MPDEVFAEDDVDLEKELAEVAETDEAEKQADASDETETREAESREEKEKSVPHGALHQERERRKEEQRLREESDRLRAETEQKYKILEERLEQINERLKPKETSYEEDPDKYILEQSRKTGETLEELRKKVDESSRREDHARQQQEIANRVYAAETAFRTERPDYDEAVRFLREGRDREYQAMGFTDPGQREQMLSQEAMQLAQTALHRGISPAEMAYQVASARGYARTEPEGNKKIESLQRGQKKSKSLSNVGGDIEKALDAEVLANMSDREFDEMMAGGAWEKIVGSL